jgi:NADH-quinone oxidoreductase subunit A
VGEYVGILIFIVLAGAVAAAFIALASALGPKLPSAVKSEPFECGEVPFSIPAGRQSVKFYLTAILFVVFDVEIVLLYPWAVVYQSLGAPGFVEAVIFLGVLMVGFYYAWDNGALEWQ